MPARKLAIIRGKGLPADAAILEIFRNKELRFGEVKQELEKFGVKYQSNKGLDKALKRLIQKNQIEKFYVQGKFPRYRLWDKDSKDTSQAISLFKNYGGKQIVRQVMQMMNPIALPREAFLASFSQQIGLYVLYVFLKQEKIYPVSENADLYKIRAMWLQKAVPIEYIGEALRYAIERYAGHEELKDHEIKTQLSMLFESLNNIYRDEIATLDKIKAKADWQTRANIEDFRSKKNSD